MGSEDNGGVSGVRKQESYVLESLRLGYRGWKAPEKDSQISGLRLADKKGERQNL